MKNYLTVTRLLVKTFMKRTGLTENKRLLVFALIGIAVVIGLIAYGTYSFAKIFYVCDAVADLQAFIFLVAFIAVLVLGTISIFTYIYFSKDNEFLLSLPVKPSVIYLAKLTVVYLQQLIISFVVIVPASIAIGISTLQLPPFYIISLLAMFIVPVMPLFLSSIIAIPIMRLTVCFKNKGAAGAIVMLVLFGLLMAGYLVVIFNFNTSIDIEFDETTTEIDIYLALIEPFRIMAMVIYPLLSLARVATLTPFWVNVLGVSMLIDAAIVIATVGVCGTLAYLISSAVYSKTALAQGENASGSKGKSKFAKSPVLKSLIKKEWKELIGNMSFAFQCLAGVIVTPIVSLLYVFIYAPTFSDFTDIDIFLWLIGFIVMHTICFNIAAMTAVTREGKTFSYSKTMPVPYKTQLKAKFILCYSIGAATAVLSVIANYIAIIVTTQVFSPTILVMSIINLIELLILHALVTVLSILHDVKKPKLDWSTPMEAVKKNMALILPTILCIVYGMIVGVLLLLGVIFLSYNFLGPFGFVCLCVSLLAVVELVLTIVFFNSMMKRADAFYNRIMF